MTIPDIKVVSYDPSLKDDFKRLNIWWIEEYFAVEPIDETILSNPESMIIEQGGEIFFACVGEGSRRKAIGVCALASTGNGEYAVSKMGVDPESQGLGAGRRILARIIEAFHQKNGKRLYLETHSSLQAAIALYEKMGFVHVEGGWPSKYDRVEVYMEYRPDAS